MVAGVSAAKAAGGCRAEQRELRKLPLCVKLTPRRRGRQQRVDAGRVLAREHIDRVAVDVAVGPLVCGEQQGRGHRCIAVDLAVEHGVDESGQRVRTRQGCCRRDGHAGGLHGALGRHRHVASLRIAGDEQLPVVLCERRGGERQRRARRSQRVDHVLGLLIGDEIGMIIESRCVVAGVIRRDDNVALRRKYRDQVQRLGILQIVHRERTVGGGAVRIEENRPRAGAVRSKPGRHHQHGGRGGGFIRSVHRLVLDVIHEKVANRSAAQRGKQQVAREVEFRQQIHRRESRQQRGRTLKQRSARRR